MTSTPFRCLQRRPHSRSVRSLPEMDLTPRHGGTVNRPASGRWLGLTVVAHRLDEDILVVPFDGIGKATPDGRPEGRQRVFECVRFVESKR